MDFEVAAIDHVQLAMPAGREDEAERFYCGLLGFARLPKPPTLARRGGCWFKRGQVQIHLGVEADFKAAKKAHPALVVNGFDAFRAAMQAAKIATRLDDEIPNTRRCYLEDPFGNRLEIIESAR